MLSSDQSRTEIFECVWSLSDQERKVIVKSLIDCVTPAE